MQFLAGLVIGAMTTGVIVWGATLGARLEHVAQVEDEYVEYCTGLEAEARDIALRSLRVMATTREIVTAVVGTDG